MLTSDTILAGSAALLSREIASGRAVELDVVPNQRLPTTRFGALLVANRTSSPAARLVLDHMRKLADEDEFIDLIAPSRNPSGSRSA